MGTASRNAARTDDVFAALASPVRRELLRLLREKGEQPVQALADRFDMSRPSVSEHLKVLLDVGLVHEQRQGRHRVYELHAEPLRAVERWLEPYEQFWRGRMTELRRVLAEERASYPGDSDA